MSPGLPHWAGDELAFAALYNEHSRVVYTAAVRFGAPRADDVTREVFVRLWRNPSRFDPTRGSIRNFLVAIARNIAIDQWRSDASLRPREEGYGANFANKARDVALWFVPDNDTDPLAAALGRIPRADSEVLVTAFYGQLTYRETAAALCMPVGTVKSRIRAGLVHLRRELEAPRPDEFAFPRRRARSLQKMLRETPG